MGTVDFNKTFDDGVIKWAARLIACGIAFFVCLYVYKGVTGQHIKILGFELNIPDTAKRIVYKTVRIKDTVFIKDKSVKNLWTKNNAVSVKEKPAYKYEVTHPNYSAIGDNARNTNYLDGFKERDFNQVEFENLLKQIDANHLEHPASLKHVRMCCMAIAESQKFAKLIQKKLKEHGYSSELNPNIPGVKSGLKGNYDLMFMSLDYVATLIIMPVTVDDTP